MKTNRNPTLVVPDSEGPPSPTIAAIENRAHRIAASRLPILTADHDDNKFLECADASRADYLVTGNRRHFPASWKSTKVVTSPEFVSVVAAHIVP